MIMKLTQVVQLGMLFSTWISIITTTIGVALAQATSSTTGVYVNASHSTKTETISRAVYQILRAEIYQRTVDGVANSSILTIREDFAVVVQGTMRGALPVRCNASWLTISVGYPAIVPLSCADPTVNVTLLQGEVWPEYGGFFLFVELNGFDPAAWMVGNHISSATGWSYEPMSNETWPPNGHWTWAGSQLLDTMPTVSLQQWIGFDSTDGS